MFCSPLCPQHPEQSLTHSKCIINRCWINWSDLHFSPARCAWANNPEGAGSPDPQPFSKTWADISLLFQDQEERHGSWAIGHTSPSWRDAQNPGPKLLEKSLLSFGLFLPFLSRPHIEFSSFNHQIHFKTAHFVSVSFSTTFVQATSSLPGHSSGLLAVLSALPRSLPVQACAASRVLMLKHKTRLSFLCLKSFSFLSSSGFQAPSGFSLLLDKIQFTHPYVLAP